MGAFLQFLRIAVLETPEEVIPVEVKWTDSP